MNLPAGAPILGTNRCDCGGRQNEARLPLGQIPQVNFQFGHFGRRVQTRRQVGLDGHPLGFRDFAGGKRINGEILHTDSVSGKKCQVFSDHFSNFNRYIAGNFEPGIIHWTTFQRDF